MFVNCMFVNRLIYRVTRKRTNYPAEHKAKGLKRQVSGNETQDMSQEYVSHMKAVKESRERRLFRVTLSASAQAFESHPCSGGNF